MRRSKGCIRAPWASLPLLSFPTLLFIEAETGAVGIAEIGMPARMAFWFATAPPVERGSVSLSRRN